MELPPGFRFHPTDEELITHYLSKKVLDINFTSIAIGEVDMNSVEPWDLPWMAKIGEKEWYFFCVRDKKYPTGLRTNRATMSGYWKATGKDKDIFRGKALVGMKKTLVFYKGRAPKGVRTNWVCHEYRLEGKLSLENIPKSSKNDWVISRVFLKTNGGKKVHMSGLMRMNSAGKELITQSPMLLPPLMDPSPSHVHCFSNNVPQKSHDDFINNDYNNDEDLMFGSASANPLFASPWTQQFNPSSVEGFHYQFAGSVTSLSPPFQDSSALKKTLPGDLNHGGLRRDVQKMISVSHAENTAISIANSLVVSNDEMKKKKTSFEEHEAPPILGVGTHDLDGFWNY